MTSTRHVSSKLVLSRLYRFLVFAVPLGWIFLPNLCLIFWAQEPFDVLDWALFTGLSLSGLAVPFLWSRTLRSCLLWNLLFAIFVAVYGGYVSEFRQAPYSGMWATLWYATSREAYEYAQIRWPVLLLGFTGMAIYLFCTFSSPNLAPIRSQAKKAYLAVLCWWAFAVAGIPAVWALPDVRLFKPVKHDVFYSSYPIGVFTQGIKTFVSLTTSNSNATAVPEFDQAHFQGREIYIQVVGESEQFYRWEEEIRRMHSPLLANRHAVIFNSNVSQASFTHLSVPMMLTGADDLEVALVSPTWLQFARARDCRTGWLTANEFQQQGWYRTAVDFSYDLNEITKGVDREMYDDMLLPEIRRVLRQGAEKLCLVVHMGGSHSNYVDRYRPEQEQYKVDRGAMSKPWHPNHKAAMHAAYQNTLNKNIRFLEAIVFELEKYDDARSFLAYAPDHGENVYDDGTEVFAHGRARPSRYELRVPLMVWASSEFIRSQPREWQAITENRDEPVSNKLIFPTLLWAMGIDDRKSSAVPTLFSSKATLRSFPRKFSIDGGEEFDYEDPAPPGH